MFEHLRRFLAGVKTVFLSGLFTIIPIAATLFFMNFLYNVMARILAPLHKVAPEVFTNIPGAEVALVMVLILLLGFVIKVFISHRVMHFLDSLVHRIPLVRIVYSAAKILVDFFKVSEDSLAFKRQVVLIPYPRKGQYHLAFLLESAEYTYERIIPETAKHYPGERFVKVFMPNSPNPTTGYFFIMPEDDIIRTDITFEEAIKTLVSCGLITPESMRPESLDKKEAAARAAQAE